MPKCSVFRNAVVNCSNFEAVLFDKHQLTLRKPLERVIRSLAQHARKISKHDFISTPRSTVHMNPSRKRGFSKTPFKPEEFENTGFAF